MKLIKNTIYLIKNNWKAMLFAVVYVFFFFVVSILSLGINQYVESSNYVIYLPILMAIALLSILSIIAKFILNLVFKENANMVAQKSSIMLVPIGIFITVALIIEILSNTQIPFIDDGGLGTFISLFAVPAYFIMLAVIGLFLLLVTSIAFVLLRLAMRYTKAVMAIFLISSGLWVIYSGILNNL